MKIGVIGCGLRTPLLIHGLSRADTGITEISLYDAAPAAQELMVSLGREIAGPSGIRITGARDLRATIEGCSFVISSIRVGGMEARARDERISLECGIAGQETTGPAGFAMALRTIPFALQHARLVAEIAPEAYIINFTNPAGLITQAIATHSRAKVVGICDTPAELIQQIAWALEQPVENIQCDYTGLNHLGWVTAVRSGARDVLPDILADSSMIRRLYPAPLFPDQLLRTLQMLPTEYVFFYYQRLAALTNQRAVGATRGEELLSLNRRVTSDLSDAVGNGDAKTALALYRAYLNRRNVSYLKLEGAGQSSTAAPEMDWDPFEGATGYHRIAIEAIAALTASTPRRVILNVPNNGTLRELEWDDIVEVPCLVDKSTVTPCATPLPDAVQGLVKAVKTFERLTIQAAVERSTELGILALSSNPLVQDWALAKELVERLNPFKTI
jgi:6-phospho-beta-glucosidase